MEKKKITDKIETLDVKGQGCLDDCPAEMWSGNTSFTQRCTYIIGDPTANTTTWW